MYATIGSTLRYREHASYHLHISLIPPEPKKKKKKKKKKPREEEEKEYINPDPVRCLPFPRAMHDLDSNKVAHVLVKLTHEIIHVEEVVELPALADHRVAQEIAQTHCFGIVGGRCGKVTDVR